MRDNERDGGGGTESGVLVCGHCNRPTLHPEAGGDAVPCGRPSHPTDCWICEECQHAYEAGGRERERKTQELADLAERKIRAEEKAHASGEAFQADEMTRAKMIKLAVEADLDVRVLPPECLTPANKKPS